MKNHQKFGSIVVGNYPMFYNCLERSIFQILETHRAPKLTSGLKIDVSFQNCTIQKQNIFSLDFLSTALRQPEGMLIYLKGSLIREVKQGELYLQNWSEIWECQCDCQTTFSRVKSKRKSQSLLQILSEGSRHPKDVKDISEKEYCEECLLPFKFVCTEDLNFVPCQELTL
jgi:hypothetical protein